MFNIGEGSSKYVKVWEVTPKENYVDAKVSSSTKKQDGEYENSNWFPRFVGGAKDKALQLQIGDLIEITKGGIKNVYDKEKKVTYYNVVVFDFEVMQHGNGGNTTPSKLVDDFESDDNMDDCPF